MTADPEFAMDFPIPLDRSLAFAPAGIPFVVGHIAFEGVAEYCDRAGLRSGDEVRCCLASPEHVVISKRGTDEIILPRRLALFVEVESPAPTPA